MLDHDPGVGGRFSALTNVGLLPAAALGLDIAAIRKGAGAALAPVLAKKKPAEVPAALGAALAVALAESKGKTISVLMAYSDRLERFTHWYVQLWAESLGKDGKGTTPLARSGRSTSTARCSSSSPARATSCSPWSASKAAGSGRAWTRSWPSLPASPGLRGKTIGDLVARRPRHRRDVGQERLPGAHDPSRRARRGRASANC